MICSLIHPIPSLLIGIAGGFFIYIWARIRAGHLPTIHGTIESAVNGCGIASGLFLILSVTWCPDNLVHLVSGREHLNINELWFRNGEGKFKPLQAHIEVTEVIAIDAVLGGLALIVACLLGLLKVSRDASIP